ncbi:hypothetical protein PHK61_26495 [Actinomycetospora lutea]|uniref:hypothetical protein n=1 Tax=Actinomycetospora lutea TaxID=663604 RepID=UPI002365CC78|nr:hypothetical protein [Actinomycetospora lutea]MDD7941970.1 hypothetical protein [Actinomycetospora lutea]
MSMTEPSQEPGDRTPVFVDASGRRRRGVLVLGYLGASAATAYMAAFGLTVGTRTVSLQPVGATLVPTPSVPDEEAEDDAAPEIVPVSSGTVTAASTVSRHAAPHRERRTARHARAERADHVTQPRARLVPVRAVRAPRTVVHTTAATTAATTVTTRETPRHAPQHRKPASHHHDHHDHPRHAHGSSSQGHTTTDPATADVLDHEPASTATRV